jgi:ornithine--oxo-acid transaminase
MVILSGSIVCPNDENLAICQIAYATSVRQMCKKYNVLFISDEVRMGAAKTGKFLSSDWLGPENKPDIIALGKSISGGAYPASFILGNEDTLGQVEPYESASTFAPTAVGLAAVPAALNIYDEENLTERSAEMQRIWEREASTWKYPFVKFITARGSDMNITVVDDYPDKRVNSSRLAALILHKGVFLYPMDNRLRMSVAMTITDELFLTEISIIKESLDEILEYDEISGAQSEGSKTITPWATLD